MLKFDNVNFGYSSNIIFSGLSMQMNPGEFCFLIGKSGSGKSTLLQMIYMNLFPQSGLVQFDKYDSKTIKGKDLPFLRRKLGIIFQDFKLLKDRNIYDNLALILEVLNTPKKEIKRRINDVLTDVNLIHRRNSMPDELSGGEKQKVAIARSVVNEPLLILADEPTGNLDPETSLEIINILQKINARGTAVLFATHNYEIIKKVDARILKLDNGKAVRAVFKQK
ncbi:MAG: ATP-binding cassette domain-containing protein [Ignavibacteriaceae bacterium]|nr:ATP-binding cassette domain-containing protein [Ignavibacteriaceae bacterium]